MIRLAHHHRVGDQNGTIKKTTLLQRIEKNKFTRNERAGSHPEGHQLLLV